MVATLTLSMLATARAEDATTPFPMDSPIRSSWHPDDPDNSIIRYSLAADPDAPFNRSAVALQPRAFQPALQANPHARANEGRVMILATFDLYENYYTFANWQLVDSLVFWGGREPNGGISAPNGNIIDAAHRNGVKVYGNVFLAPKVYGGQLSRVHDFAKRDAGGRYIVADKLIEIARYHGFDGWFINQETEDGNEQLATELREMLLYIRRNSGLDVIWYDSMLERGPIAWQGAVNDRNDAFVQHDGEPVSDAVFIDFRWQRRDDQPAATAQHMSNALGRNRYEAYLGVDTEANRWDVGVLHRLFPDDANGTPLPHLGSLGIYRPEFTARWTKSVEQFLREDDQFWQGANNNPADTAGSVGTNGWKGIAHYVAERTPVVGNAFVTHFNLGQGRAFFVDGERSNDQAWVNIGLQDVLPTWRWRFEGSGDSTLTATWDFDDAYWGGSSIRIAGRLAGQVDLPLYMAKIAVQDDSRLQLTYRPTMAGDTGLAVLITLEGNESESVALPVGEADDAGWQQAGIDLAPFRGKTIAAIGVRFEGGPHDDYRVNLGGLAVLRGEPDVVVPPSNPRFQKVTLTEDGSRASVRLLWDHSHDFARDASSGVAAYHVFRIAPDGRRTFVGGTSNNALFLDLPRQGDETASPLEIEAVRREFGRSPAVELLLDWAAAPQPAPAPHHPERPQTNNQGELPGKGEIHE